jgi:hypothetical protein
MKVSGQEAGSSPRKLPDLLFQRVQLDLPVQERNADHHAEPLSHLLRIGKDEDRPVYSRHRPAVLHLVNLVRQLYRTNTRKLVQVLPTVLQDQIYELQKQLDRPVAFASRKDSPYRQYETGVPRSILAKEPRSRQLGEKEPP